jgi:hypothetical protein
MICAVWTVQIYTFNSRCWVKTGKMFPVHNLHQKVEDEKTASALFGKTEKNI